MSIHPGMVAVWKKRSNEILDIYQDLLVGWKWDMKKRGVKITHLFISTHPPPCPAIRWMDFSSIDMWMVACRWSILVFILGHIDFEISFGHSNGQ